MTEQNLAVGQQLFEPVRHEVTVPLAPQAAFSLFTTDFNSWWPGHHIGEADLEVALIEPAAGGRWYERGVDGSECDWGEVLVYSPPTRLVLRWQLNEEWEYDSDPAHGSEIEVTFTADVPGHTTVRLEHRHFERHGAGARQVRDGVGADGGGWGSLMKLYADKAAA